jgi:hypothetical protein
MRIMRTLKQKIEDDLNIYGRLEHIWKTSGSPFEHCHLAIGKKKENLES